MPTEVLCKHLSIAAKDSVNFRIFLDDAKITSGMPLDKAKTKESNLLCFRPLIYFLIYFTRKQNIIYLYV